MSTDMASVGLRVDSRQVRTASGDLDKFAGAGDRAGGSAGRAQGAFAGMGKGLAVAAASALAAVVSIAALSSQLNRFIDATVTNEKAQAQLGAAILSTGGAAGRSLAQLNEHAAALQKVTNFGDEATNAMQGVLLTFTQIKGDQFDEATKATLDLATAMGTDLSSAALQVGKALNDPVLGMTALGRSGITFTEAQKDMVKEMVAANDIIGAQTVILAELEKQFGGSAEAARDTLGGALASLQNAFGDLFELSGPGSENLRVSIEQLTAAVANPAFFAAVQSIGTGLFAAAEMGVGALTALTGAFTLLTQNIDIVAISLGVLALTQVQAMVAALVTLALKVAFAATSYTALAIAMKAIPFVAAVAGLTILYRLLATTADFAKDGAAAFNGFNDATASLSGVTEVLEKDYISLEAAQRSMADAVKIGSGIERDAAIQAVSGINARITANENLRRDLALTQKSQLNALRVAAEAAENLFNTRTSLIAAGALLRDQGMEFVGFNEAQAKLQADGVEAITEAYRRLLTAQVAAGGVLTDIQQEYLEGMQAVEATKQQVIDAVAALELLEVPANLAPNLDNAAGSAGVLERNLIAAGSALASLVNSTANLGLEAIGLEAQNRALEAGNTLIEARNQGLIAIKREELSSALGPSSPDGLRAAATLELDNYIAALGRTSAAQTENHALTKNYNNSIRETGRASGSAAGRVTDMGDKIEKLTTFAQGMGAALKGGTKDAVEMGREFGGSLLSGIGSVSDAFGDFIMRGFTDFKGFVASILDSFKSMLAQMISMAVRNRIMLSIGASGGGVGQAVADVAGKGGIGGGGLLGGMLGSFGGKGGILGMGGLGGGTGLLGGLGNAVSGGLGNIFSIGANAAAAGTAGVATFASTIGAAVPIIGAVALAFSFFRTKTKELDAGIIATVTGMDTLVQSFRTVEKSRFFGLSKSVSTTIGAAGQATTDAITDIVGTLQGSVMASADALGLAGDTFEDFSHRMRISTKGLSEEAANEAVQEALMGMADAMAGMVSGLDAFARDGEGAAATLERLAQSLIVVNARMADLGMNTYAVSLAGAGAASAFVDLFGSLENFNAVSQSYYQNFFTDAERLARATELLSIEMLALGIDALPSTRAAFRALIDEADALGDSGLVASLMQLSPAFAEISAGADALGDSLRSLVNEDLFTTGQDYTRALSRSSNSQTFTPQQSDAELRAELRALNVSMERLVSTSEITAGNTGRGADAADDTLAFQLEQTL